VQQLLDDK